jgi:HSP20 family molecular chaperone IbpA
MLEKIKTIFDKGRDAMTSSNHELTVKKANGAVSSERRLENWLTPAVDIFENNDGLTLVADLPGVGREQLNLGVEQGVLTIEADTGSSYGYYRRFQLPEHLDIEHVQAELKHGVLTLQLPKAETAKPRKIAVTVH